MLRDQITWILGTAVAILTVVAIVTQLLKQRKDSAAAARAELDRVFKAGADSRNDEVALIKSERDDARRDAERSERNETEARRAEAEARRTLSLMQRPIADFRLEAPRPRPGDQD